MTKKDRKKLGKSSRVKGHNYERAVVKELKAMGVECGTSRLHSKWHDDQKIDIFMMDKTPLNIQCKNNNVYHNPIPIIKEMPEDENYNVVFQKIKHGGQWVTMSKDDFYEMINILLTEKIWQKKKD